MEWRASDIRPLVDDSGRVRRWKFRIDAEKEGQTAYQLFEMPGLEPRRTIDEYKRADIEGILERAVYHTPAGGQLREVLEVRIARAGLRTLDPIDLDSLA